MRMVLTIVAAMLFGACNAAAQPAKMVPRLSFEVTECDFGDIRQSGGNVSCEFPFVNNGTAPLVIYDVKTSCTCTKASYSRRPVPPGGRGTIKITYEPGKKETGVFYKVIQVYSNADGGCQVVVIRGCSVE